MCVCIRVCAHLKVLGEISHVGTTALPRLAAAKKISIYMSSIHENGKLLPVFFLGAVLALQKVVRSQIFTRQNESSFMSGAYMNSETGFACCNPVHTVHKEI